MRHSIHASLIFTALVASIGMTASAGESPAAPARTNLDGAADSVMLPTRRPTVIYVTEFRLDASKVEQAKKASRQGPLGGKLSLRKNQPQEDPEDLMRILTDSIIKQLKSEGLRSEALPNVGANFMPDQAAGRLQFLPGNAVLPKEGWLVSGWIEEIQGGKAAMEAGVGFGAGSGKATADVVVSDLARDPAQPFLLLGSGSRAKKVPGGVVMKNPYVMAAKFVINKRQGTEKDVKSLGSEIGKSLGQYITATLRSEVP